MTDFNFTADFSSIAAGSLFNASQQQLVYNDPNVRWAWTGVRTAFSVVAEGTTGGNCFQVHFVPGDVGAGYGGQTKEYQVNCTPVEILNLESDWKFKTGFDFHSQGKTAMSMRIVHPDGNVTSMRFMWNYRSSLVPPSHFRMYAGNDTTGVHWGDTSVAWNIVEDTWYHLHQQMKAGADGWARMWIKRPTDLAEVLVYDQPAAGTDIATTDPTMKRYLSFSTFFGGAGAAIACRNDSYALQDNIHIYSGLTPPVIGPTIQSARLTIA